MPVRKDIDDTAQRLRDFLTAKVGILPTALIFNYLSEDADVGFIFDLYFPHFWED